MCLKSVDGDDLLVANPNHQVDESGEVNKSVEELAVELDKELLSPRVQRDEPTIL